MASSNEAVIAAAGSGKTSYLVAEAIADSSKRVLIVTYTNENLREINARLWQETRGHPANVETMTLFEFLLRECVKPYQTYKAGIAQIRSVNFVANRNDLPRFPKSNFKGYYLDRSNNLYSDVVSDLACALNEVSRGKVIARLEAIYDRLLIDEMQDLAGWDLEFLLLLLRSSIDVVMVGDPRQAVYLTNRSQKNSQFRGPGFVTWIDTRVRAGECTMAEHTHSHRCVQPICDFADSLYPELPATLSQNGRVTGHDGVFLVHESDVDVYRAAFEPQELRWDRRNTQAGPHAKNFGQVKGLTFPRVLIFPTETIVRYIEQGKPLAEGSLAKFYVAVTRARQSVAIVTSKRTTKSDLTFWWPSETAGTPTE